MARVRESVGIAAADIAAYQSDGVVCLRGLFDGGWIRRLRVALERNMKQPGPWHRSITKPGQPGNFYYDSMMWRFDPEFRAFAEQSPAAEIAGRIMGAEAARFFYDQLFVKDPEQKKTVGDLVTDAVAKLGENIVIRRFARFQLGEISGVAEV